MSVIGEAVIEAERNPTIHRMFERALAIGKRVLLAHEMVMFRQALKAVLEREGFAVVAEASDGLEAVELARKHEPDVAILGIARHGLNVLQVTSELRATCPSVRPILLSMPDDAPDAVKAVQCGARGLLVALQPVEDLVWVIREVLRGGVYVSPMAGSAAVAVRQAAEAMAEKGLSTRRRQVLELVAAGKSTKEIAALLKIAVKTAGFHRYHLMKSLSIHDTAGLVRYAIRHGLIRP